MEMLVILGFVTVATSMVFSIGNFISKTYKAHK